MNTEVLNEGAAYKYITPSCRCNQPHFCAIMETVLAYYAKKGLHKKTSIINVGSFLDLSSNLPSTVHIISCMAVMSALHSVRTVLCLIPL